mmetsp:Transcript_51382/g.101824  ORF Transcript_51382/g.101824 Transcript_51382/m.101824 type:complete len:294 (+) Transcript_51382:410-1291(+)
MPMALLLAVPLCALLTSLASHNTAWMDRWLVGSSSSNTSGRAKMAAAKATRTRHPPESAINGRARRSAEKPRLTSSSLARSSAVSASMASNRSTTAISASPSPDGGDPFCSSAGGGGATAAAPAAAPLTAPATAVAAVALPLPTRNDQKKRNRLCFLGDEGLKLLLTDPLKRMAAETKPQALLDSLDVHLATLATLRLLLLKRKNLLTLLAAQSAYTDANTATLRSECGDEGGNDTSCVSASAPPGFLCSSKTLGVWQRAVGTLKATLAKAARPLVPTTTTATTTALAALHFW